MGLQSTVKGAVKLANKLTLDLHSTVTFKRYLSQSGDGSKTFASPVSLRAIVSDKQEEIRTLAGQISKSSTTIVFVDEAALLAATGNNGVKEQDEITLQNGDGGPILATGGFINRSTGIPFATKVWMG